MSNEKTAQISSSTPPTRTTEDYERRNGGGVRTLQPKKPIKPTK